MFFWCGHDFRLHWDNWNRYSILKSKARRFQNDIVLCAASTGVNVSFCKRLPFGRKNRGRIFAGRISVQNGQGTMTLDQRSLFRRNFSLQLTYIFLAVHLSTYCNTRQRILPRSRPNRNCWHLYVSPFPKKNCVASRYTLNCLQISGNKTCRGHDATAEKTDKFSFSRKRFRTGYFLRRFRKDVTLSVWNLVRVKYKRSLRFTIFPREFTRAFRSFFSSQSFSWVSRFNQHLWVVIKALV